MVKVGIIGAESPLAGEIIRILVNHPETEIMGLHAPSLFGHNVTSIHHGLIGEQSLIFTDKIILEDLSFLILIGNSELGNSILSQLSYWENLKIVIVNDLTDRSKLDFFEIGLSEVNRKALVRGAQYAYIPSPVIVPALIALFPIANYLLLNSDIQINIQLPSDISENLDEEKEAKKIEDLLKNIQVSYNGKVNLKINSDHQSERAATTLITFNNNLSISEVEKIFESIYDDHNFTFITRNLVNVNEVEGTQKVVLQINKPSLETLEIKIVSDARMRGGAGDVVHVLNLFFGLHEKTGLNLKPSRF